MTHAFRHEPRISLTDQQRAKLFLDRDGRCEGSCGNRKLGPSDIWHIDHIIALENGGTNDVSNLQILCEWCHRPKTAQDASKAAKMRAVAVSCYVPTSQRQKKGKPIDGSRRSRWKKKMSGEVERRS